MYATLPMDDEDDFSSLRVDIDHDFANEGSHDTLLQAWIGAIVMPDGFKLGGEAFEFLARRNAGLSFKCTCSSLFSSSTRTCSSAWFSAARARRLPDGSPGRPHRTVSAHAVRCSGPPPSRARELPSPHRA